MRIFSNNSAKEKAGKRNFSLPYINSSKNGELYCNKLNPMAEFLFRFSAYYKLLFQLIRKKVPLLEIIKYRFPFFINNYKKPTIVSIEFSTYCNLKCKYCVNSLNVMPKGFMELSIFSKIIEGLDLMKISRVHIVGNGEQTLHPDFDYFIDKLSQTVKYIDIVTNGQWLNNKVADTLIRSKVDRIDVSIDIGGKEHYESVRVGADYEKLKSNLIYLKEKKDHLNPHCIINIRLMLQPSKREFLKNEMKFWKKYCDTIMIAPLCKFSHQDEYIQYDDDIFTLTAKKYEYPKCYFPFNEMHFVHTGNAPFCQLLGYKKDPEDIYIGNIKNKTIEELWINTRMKDLREGQKKGIAEKMPYCKGCSTC